MTPQQKATYQYFFVVLLTVKNVPYLSFNVSSTKVRIEDTVFFRLLLETELPFYVVIQGTQRSSRLKGKESTFISQFFY